LHHQRNHDADSVNDKRSYGIKYKYIK
jgi:hypothetical protein